MLIRDCQIIGQLMEYYSEYLLDNETVKKSS